LPDDAKELLFRVLNSSDIDQPQSNSDCEQQEYSLHLFFSFIATIPAIEHTSDAVQVEAQEYKKASHPVIYFDRFKIARPASI